MPIEKKAFATTFAQRGDLMACSLETELGRVFTGYTVTVTRTEDTTGGGKRAMQHITLVRNGDGLTFVIGSANTGDGTATLRTLGHSLALSKRRFGKELVLPPLEYMRFLEAATRVLVGFDLRVSVVAHEATPSTPPARPAQSGTHRRITLPYIVGFLASVSTCAAVGAALIR